MSLNDQNPGFFEIPTKVPISVKTNNNMGKPRKVLQYTLEGECLKGYESATKAEKETGTNHQHILQCCKFKRTYAGECRWLFPADADRAEELFKEHPITQYRGYTEDAIIAEADKYEYIDDFRKGSPKFYTAALWRKMIDKLGLKRKLNPYMDNIYSVYGYFFEETHGVYIGITDNKERRKKEHKNPECNTPVFRYANENGLEVKEPVYLEENLSASDALVLEDEYKLYYKEIGWIVINKGPTGLKSGSLGAVKKISDKQVRDAAANCEYLRDFELRYNSLCKIARSRGYINDLGLKYKKARNGTNTEEYCYNIARNYRTIEDFTRDYPGVVGVARQKGWFKQYWWLSNWHNHDVVAFKGFKVRAFKNITEAAKYVGLSHSVTFDVLKKRGKKMGISFHLLDMNDVELRIPDFEHRIIV